MSFYLIIRGPLGCGKSTITKALAKMLNAKYISIDTVLKENGLDRTDNKFTSKDFIKVNNILLPKARKELSKGKIVIFDGCFYFKEQIHHLKTNLNFNGFVFSLKAKLETCIKRDSKRKRIYGEKATREVYELLNKFDCGINIDTEDKTEEETATKILFYLPKL